MGQGVSVVGMRTASARSRTGPRPRRSRAGGRLGARPPTPDSGLRTVGVVEWGCSLADFLLGQDRTHAVVCNAPFAQCASTLVAVCPVSCDSSDAIEATSQGQDRQRLVTERLDRFRLDLGYRGSGGDRRRSDREARGAGSRGREEGCLR